MTQAPNAPHERSVSPPRPEWVDGLSSDELRFVERFVLCSGSLKALAKEYQVSYPTLRQRLDAVIERLQSFQSETQDGPFKQKLRQMLRDGAISIDAARQLAAAFEEETP
jgi:hypothetical protein